MECNGYSNKQFSRGEGLDIKDVKRFVESIKLTKPRIREASLFKKTAIIFDKLILDKKL